jgi:ribosome-binding factor A
MTALRRATSSSFILKRSYNRREVPGTLKSARHLNRQNQGNLERIAMTYRRERAGSFIREELTLMLQTEIDDPGLAPLVITDVDVTKDRRIARVYVAAYTGEEDLQEGLKALARAKAVMRSRIAEGLQWPFAPDLEFRPDRSIQHGQRIDEILAQLERERLERGAGSAVQAPAAEEDEESSDASA